MSHWRVKEPKGDGILVGADLTQEWLLPWWWGHYQRHNHFPVTFVNFGLSLEMKEWCRQKGELVSIPLFAVEVAEKREIAPGLIDDWEANYGKNFWDHREAWFKKPLACLQTPYKRTLWIDLDCEIRQPLNDLFEQADHPSGISLIKDHFTSYQIYNSGVIAFRHSHPIIQEWAEQAFDRNQFFPGDQDLLSQIIAEKTLSISEMDPKYNWSRCKEDRLDTVILHWHGNFGKSIIRYQIQCKTLQDL